MMKNGSVPVGDSTMDYVCFGRGEKALVILPGLSDGLATVKGKAALLAGPYRPYFDRYTVYMFSRRNGLPVGTSIRDMAADQAGAMERLGVKKAAVMGVSQGGMIAQWLAIDRPDLVEALVLAVTAPSANDLVRECVSRWLEMTERGDHKQLMIDTAEMSYSPAYLAKYRKFYPVLGRVGKPAEYARFRANAEAILAFDATEELGRISCPTLILGGEEDKIVGAEAARELHRRIPDSELHLYPGLGHAAYEEAKDYHARIFAFLDREDRRSVS